MFSPPDHGLRKRKHEQRELALRHALEAVSLTEGLEPAAIEVLGGIPAEAAAELRKAAARASMPRLRRKFPCVTGPWLWTPIAARHKASKSTCEVKSARPGSAYRDCAWCARTACKVSPLALFTWP